MSVTKRAWRRLVVGLRLGQLLPAYVMLGLLKHFVPLEWLVRLIWQSAAGSRNLELEQRLVAAVIRLSQLAGQLDGGCLQRSLLLYRVLSGAGANPDLVVGFHRMNGQLFGHAWIVVDGRAVVESEVDLLRFYPTFSFGAGGRLRMW
jgi:hypothetical protein